MRMDPSLTTTADDLVNKLSVTELTHIFKVFGEVKDSGHLAKKVVDHRPIHTTTELAKYLGPETRPAFQALRIAVNDELGSLEIALPQAISCLAKEGRLVVITFHSLEDRIVKEQFNHLAIQQLGIIVTPKPIVPSSEEIEINPRSKSAKLRVFKKL